MLNLVLTPIFLGLAVINFLQPSPICIVPGALGFLSSMWLMYLLMGLSHAAICVALLNKRPRTKYSLQREEQ
jgi:hypothetical protein